MEPINLFIEKMHKENLPQAAIDVFIHYYSKLKAGDTGLITEKEIKPVLKTEIDHLNAIPSKSNTELSKLIAKVVCIKLNGGLGTTMGLQGPKSLIPVKDNLNFLDITSQALCAFNKLHNVKVPLILMNSFRTERESITALKKYPEVFSDMPISFVQNKFPKIVVSTLLPASYAENPELEWNPPGHGDLYIAFQTSGILSTLIQKGFRYAFISNIDNLGANLDTAILSYLADNQIPFLMEVTERTWMDRKGGHLARLKNDHLILREAAQCPENDLDSFRDISKHSFFNTNNLWIDLLALKNKLSEHDNFLDLPMIRNRKKLNPISKDSPDIYQVESAMGSAISIFDNARALQVPRKRFAPVKNCEDLLLLWSDAFVIDENCQIIDNPDKKFKDITVQLDSTYYSFLAQLTDRFPYGAPSFIECKDITIRGDIRFGKNIKLINSVVLTNSQPKQVTIPDNSAIDKNIVF